MKKLKYFVIVSMIFSMFVSSYIPVYGDDAKWIEEAFDAARDFLNEDISETDITIDGSDETPSPEDSSTTENETVGIVSGILKTFKMIVKATNTVLLVVLAGLSTISLAITGIRYIMSKASPAQKEIAVNNLHTVFKGMFFGFGAYLIWSIAMSVVQIVIGMMASS